MLLPQSSAFSTLKERLVSVSTLGLLHLLPKSKLVSHGEGKGQRVQGINWDELEKHFRELQHRHTIARTTMAGLSPR